MHETFMDPMTLWYSHTCDFNKCGVKGHLGDHWPCDSESGKTHGPALLKD